jgi:hypothetical protein
MNKMKHSKFTKIESGKYVEWASWVLEYHQYEYPKDYNKVKKLITDNLEEKYCPPKYRKLNQENKFFGHCYHSSQALYYFFVDANLRIMSAPCSGPAEQHWWLQDRQNNILDVTANQYDLFENIDPPYIDGKDSKWYGWRNRPHRKTQELMRKIQPESKLYFEKYMEKPQKSY